MAETHETAPEPQSDPELFVDFVNTLRLADGVASDDTGADAEAVALRAWLASRGLLDGSAPLRSIHGRLPAFRDLRALVHEITERVVEHGSPTAAQVRRLNRVLRDGLHYHQLRPTGDGSRFTMAQVGDPLESARATIANSLAHYLAEHDVERLRICANDTCRWRFVDRSPAGRRRWCDMRVCGNRAKVARHRAKVRGSAAPS